MPFCAVGTSVIFCFKVLEYVKVQAFVGKIKAASKLETPIR